MNIKYSVFISNVASCCDRYCKAYGRPFSIEEMFDRVKSIPSLEAVDVVLTEDFKSNLDVLKDCLKKTGLKLASVAVDTFANPVYQKGSLASTNEEIRQMAISDTKFAIDFAKEMGCKIVTLWPGQDGYDYMFSADYIKERTLFSDALKEICEYDKDITVTLEYKLKEPRTHSYINTVGTTLLMLNEINCDNAGIALDYGHAVLGYENPAESVAICKMYGDRLEHIHINDNYGVWDDDMIVGNVNTITYLEFLYWLKKTDYSGYITFDQFPYREDGRDAVAESAEWMSYLIELVDKADEAEMERLSLTEFKDYCVEHKIKNFTYNTNNQKWYDKYTEFMIIDLNFTEAGISLNPNILYFKKEKSVMRLNCVKCIYVTEETETESKVFFVVCGIDTDKKQDKKIVFIGSR